MANRLYNQDSIRGRLGSRQQLVHESKMSRLYVGQLPSDVTEASLRKRFEVFGDLDDVTISRNQNSRPVGVLQYHYQNDAVAALQGMRGSTFEGEQIDVRMADETQGITMDDNLSSMRQSILPTTISQRSFTSTAEGDILGSIEALDRSGRAFKCPKRSCFYHKKGFETQRELDMHENFHAMEEEEFSCKHPGCDFESQLESDVATHMEREHGIVLEDTYSDDFPQSGIARQQTWPKDEKRGLHEQYSQPDSRTSKDEKQDLRNQSDTTQDDEKTRYRREQQRREMQTNYRPFKCQFSSCKFAREGFETLSDKTNHENSEHEDELKNQRSLNANPESSYDFDALNVEASLAGTIELNQRPLEYTDTPNESSQHFQGTPEYLHCNNTTCNSAFEQEHAWREHVKSCKSVTKTKRCSFTDCKTSFESNSALLVHEFQSHGIRVCGSMTCNRGFHQEDDAQDHMRQLHPNMFSEGRRPRLAFISSIPALTPENSETGFPYDPYRCAVLNLTDEPKRTPTRKGKELSVDFYNQEQASTTQGAKPVQKRREARLIAAEDISQIMSITPTSAESEPTKTGSSYGTMSSRDSLPRYSVLMGTSQTKPTSPRSLGNVAEAHAVASVMSSNESQSSRRPTSTPRRSSAPSTAVSERAIAQVKQSTRAILPTIPSSQERPPSPVKDNQSRDPLYRYGPDGSRYVNGALIMSPDRHKVLVLKSTSEATKSVYDLPRGFWQVNDDNGQAAAALREAWQKAGIIGKIIKGIEPAPAEEPDENGLADWHSYFEVETEKERQRWPSSQQWQRIWLNYREARTKLSDQPDLIRALERSTIFKRGGSPEATSISAILPGPPVRRISPPRKSREVEIPQQRTKKPRTSFPTRKYSVVSPAKDNVAVWRSDVLPWLRKNFSTVMGDNKNGAIELLRVRDQPTICITCTDPKALQLQEFENVVSGLFPMHVKPGILSRSAGNRSRARSSELSHDTSFEVIGTDDEEETGYVDDASGSEPESALSDDEVDSDLPQRTFPLPPVFGKYQQRPSCGTPIGVADDDEGSGSAGTFGGVVILVEDGVETPYGLISHHVLEEKTDDTELSVGVEKGFLVDSKGEREFPIQQPSKMDIDESIDSLNMQWYYCQRDEKRFCDDDDGKTLRTKKAFVESLDPQTLNFGRVEYSSGYGLDMNRHQMDWALIGDIPAWRLEDNIVAGAETFYDLHYDGRPNALYPVEKSFFNFLSETFQDEDKKDMSDLDPLRRVHGVGSYSGIMDGLVSSETSFFRLDGIDSEEWFFTPRYNGGLGVKGDSGTWIFDDFGKVVGQIIAYNYSTHVTYFTRMDYLFEHIKYKTKATEVFFPHRGYLEKYQSSIIGEQSRLQTVEEVASRSDGVTDSGYGDSSSGTSKTGDTEITTPSQSSGMSISFGKGDGGLGWDLRRSY